VKRAFDVFVAAVGLVVTAPLWPVIALALKLTSGGPALYAAERVGRHGVPFRMLKFHTMVARSHAAAPPSRAGDPGPRVTAADDPRITPLGRFLRARRLDELPQLLNVLAGHMSVVGPRPEDPRYVATYTAEQRRVLSVRPGLVSPAVLAYRDEEQLLAAVDDVEAEYLSTVLPAKLALDLAYVDSRSLAGDLRIMWTTVRMLVRR